jgi:hypothetical protein
MYFLPDSLSSQRLWKQTAGQRPPQPAEERAFCEKMWAQNFARSKVLYSVPVEVLTAASPISLSAFYDTNFSNTDMERTGSQNSSRDWGWFEDVHQSLHEQRAAGGNSPGVASGRPKKKRGLVPQVSEGEMNDYAKQEITGMRI